MGDSESCYCECLSTEGNLRTCTCGEDVEVYEWRWHEEDHLTCEHSIVLSPDKKGILFHPCRSMGTATVRGDTLLKGNYQYYWEIKVLTCTNGTDVMVGIGDDCVETGFTREYMSMLGNDKHSYGLSYTGFVIHNRMRTMTSTKFSKGSIIGVRLDMWLGTLEFYLNRQSEGIAFSNINTQQEFYPMLSSTMAQSQMRLTYASSWRPSLLVDAAKILACSISSINIQLLPPGMQQLMKKHFWLFMPTNGRVLNKDTSSSYFRKKSHRVVRHLPKPFSATKLMQRRRRISAINYFENQSYFD